MVAKGKVFASSIVTVSMVSILSTAAYHLGSSSFLSSNNIMGADEGGAVAGRFVSIPAKVYRDSFRTPIRLGQCPLVMQEGSIKTCKDEFDGEVVYIAKASSTVDVTRVQNSEDILKHIMGGLGVSIGVLGLISVTPKVQAATTTETGLKTLNLMSSYEMRNGVLTLHNPRVKNIEGDRALFLSEIELGGNEMILVTLGFESEKEKTEVEVSVTFKIIFISITAKLHYVNEVLRAKANCRIQFKSSWRKEEDRYFSHISDCIPWVEKIENTYLEGPRLIRDMDPENETSHYFYHFSSWKSSPYGTQFNLALINHDLEFLTEQNAEFKAVIHRINKLKDQPLPSDARKQMAQLNTTLAEMTQKLTTGLDKYHSLKPAERQQLRDIYGQHKAPQYYRRYLDRIIA